MGGPITPDVLLNEARNSYRKAKKSPKDLVKLSDLLLAPIQTQSEAVPDLACRKGCAHCCYLRVVAYSFEVVSIYFYLSRRLHGAALQQFKEKLAKQATRISGLSREQHFVINIECPMLGSNKDCMVWPVRPIACAGYHSINELSCKDSYENPEVLGTENGGIPMIAEIKEVQSVQNRIAEATLAGERADGNQYELIAALHALFENPKLIKRWRDGKKAFLFLSD